MGLSSNLRRTFIMNIMIFFQIKLAALNLVVSLLIHYLLKIKVLSQLHVLGVDPEDFHSANSIRDSNVHFTIEAAKATESRVNGVGPVR